MLGSRLVTSLLSTDLFRIHDTVKEQLEGEIVAVGRGIVSVKSLSKSKLVMTGL